MEEQAVKKRGWVKNAAIIFLSVMLVLTFFSNTIMNRSLPEVSTASVESGTINAKIRGNGTVTAGESYDVVLKQTRKVDVVYVKTGDLVETGDVLFMLSDSDSSELEEAQSRLDEMRLNYQKSLLSMDDPDYASDNRAIQKQREALAKAIADRDACLIPEQAILDAQLALRSAQDNSKELLKEKEDADAALTELQQKKSALESTVAQKETAIQDLEDSLEKAKRDLRDLNSGISDIGGKLAQAQKELAAAKQELSAARITFGADYDALAEKAKDIQPGITGEDLLYQMEALVKNADDPNITEDNQKASAEQKLAFEILSPCLSKVAKAEKSVQQYTDMMENQTSVQEQIAALRASIEKMERDLDREEGLRSDAIRSLRKIEEKIEEWEEEAAFLAEDAETAAEQIASLKEAFDALKAKKDNYEIEQGKVASIQEDLDNMVFALAEKKKQDGKQDAIQQLDLSAARKEIDKQAELVEELKQNASGQEVTASVSGLITSVNAVSGREINAGEALASIEVVDRGYTIRIPVTNEQSKRVRIGDQAEVTNYYWGDTIQATLTQIANDPEKPGQGKVLVFNLTGDISSGQNLTLSIGEKSANFDSLIPNSAIRTDTNGTFVLVVTAKNSPLGNRYSATRVDVSVLAQDDTTSAVSGLSYGDYVITNSSRPLESGMLVKMVDNQ